VTGRPPITGWPFLFARRAGHLGRRDGPLETKLALAATAMIGSPVVCGRASIAVVGGPGSDPTAPMPSTASTVSSALPSPSSRCPPSGPLPDRGRWSSPAFDALHDQRDTPFLGTKAPEMGDVHLIKVHAIALRAGPPGLARSAALGYDPLN
jgi:hypothetical protein